MLAEATIRLFDARVHGRNVAVHLISGCACRQTRCPGEQREQEQTLRPVGVRVAHELSPLLEFAGGCPAAQASPISEGPIVALGFIVMSEGATIIEMSGAAETIL